MPSVQRHVLAKLVEQDCRQKRRPDEAAQRGMERRRRPHDGPAGEARELLAQGPWHRGIVWELWFRSIDITIPERIASPKRNASERPLPVAVYQTSICASAISRSKLLTSTYISQKAFGGECSRSTGGVLSFWIWRVQ